MRRRGHGHRLRKSSYIDVQAKKRHKLTHTPWRRTIEFVPWQRALLANDPFARLWLGLPFKTRRSMFPDTIRGNAVPMSAPPMLANRDRISFRTPSENRWSSLPAVGIEPTRGYPQRILSPQRLTASGSSRSRASLQANRRGGDRNRKEPQARCRCHTPRAGLLVANHPVRGMQRGDRRREKD